MSLNIVILAGHLTKDPELKYLPSGMAVCNFTLGANRKLKNSEGEDREEVSFIKVVAFGRQGELVSQSYQKGSLCVVKGRLKQERWEVEGKQRDKTVIMLEELQFTSKKSDNREEEAPY